MLQGRHRLALRITWISISCFDRRQAEMDQLRARPGKGCDSRRQHPGGLSSAAGGVLSGTTSLGGGSGGGGRTASSWFRTGGGPSTAWNPGLWAGGGRTTPGF
jgi:hypothetical protein